jgi:hypothetical protein
MHRCDGVCSVLPVARVHQYCCPRHPPSLLQCALQYEELVLKSLGLKSLVLKKVSSSKSRPQKSRPPRAESRKAASSPSRRKERRGRIEDWAAAEIDRDARWGCGCGCEQGASRVRAGCEQGASRARAGCEMGAPCAAPWAVRGISQWDGGCMRDGMGMGGHSVYLCIPTGALCETLWAGRYAHAHAS